MEDQDFMTNLDYVLFCFVLKDKHYLYGFIILLHLISFLLTRSLLVPYAHISIESIDCILLSSFKIKAILLISSIKTFCFSLLNYCCGFNIDLLLFMNYLSFVLILSTPILFISRGFIQSSGWVASKQFL